MNKKRELLERLKSEEIIVKEVTEGVSGKELPFYINLKKAYGNPKLLFDMGEALAGTVPDGVAAVASAVGLGGLPLAVSTARSGNFKLTMVRESKKEHGTRSLIEGYIPAPGEKIWLIDDVMTTGSSLDRTRNIVEKETRAEVLGTSVVFVRGENRYELVVHHLFEAEELLV